MKKALVLMFILLFAAAPVYAGLFGDSFDIDPIVDYLKMIIAMIPVDMGAHYRVPPTPWVPSAPDDPYGKLSGWTAAINGGGAPDSGYAQATEPLDDYGDLINQFPLAEREHLKTRYSSVGLSDGINRSGIRTIGEIRKNAGIYRRTLQSLENGSLSNDPDMNTVVAVLDKISAASVASLRGDEDSRKVLIALLELHLAASKRERDAETREMNSHIRRVREGRGVSAQYTSTMADDLKSFTLP